jgi:anti-anti-sigma regulatory factor
LDIGLLYPNWISLGRATGNETQRGATRWRSHGDRNQIGPRRELYMLKIRRAANGKVVFTVSGRIEAEDVNDLKQLLDLETAGQKHLVLDLSDVTLVNEGAVQFLADCEADSIKLENCPAYIREWIEQVKGRIRRRRTR